MDSPAQLEIHRSVLIAAPRTVVWNCLIDPGKFFNQIMGAQLTEAPASSKTVIADFGEGYKSPIHFVRVEPEHHLSLRWHYEPVPLDGPFVEAGSTLVRFELFDDAAGTRLEFHETGFENLPESIRQTSYDQVSLGWPGILDALASIAPRGGDAWLRVKVGGAIKASPAKVWEAVVRLEFFSELRAMEGRLEPGQLIVFDFGAAKTEALVTEVAEGHRLSFRWSHDREGRFREDQSTLVTIEIVPYQDGSWVVLSESEFDRVPHSLRTSIFKQMSEGWQDAVSTLAAKITP